jgi:hypothetical protein
MWGNFTSSSATPGYSVASTVILGYLQALTGCGTSGYVLSPQSGTCVAQTGGGAGVSAINTLTGAVVLAAGSNITLTPSGNTITIASTGGGTVPTGTGSPYIISGVQQSAAIPMCQSDGTNCFTSTLYNSEIFGSQAAGGSDNIGQNCVANHSVFVQKNNEWEICNNGDTLSKVARISDIVMPFPALTDGGTVTWAMNASGIANNILTLIHTTTTRTLNVTGIVNGSWHS